MPFSRMYQDLKQGMSKHMGNELASSASSVWYNSDRLFKEEIKQEVPDWFCENHLAKVRMYP